MNTLARLFAVGALIIAICLLNFAGENGPRETNAAGQAQPTPTVDLARARATLDAHGELTYEEVVALQADFLGPWPDGSQGMDKFNEQMSEYEKRWKEFDARLALCKLKETVGWIENWTQDHDRDSGPISGKKRLNVLVYDPYRGAVRDSHHERIEAVSVSDEQIAKLKHGQRVKISAAMLEMNGRLVVTNATITPFDDEIKASVSASELQDVSVILNRTACYGACPVYELAIDPDGTVSFNGHMYTRVAGEASGKVDGAAMAELAAEIKRADFFSLAPNYTSSITDLPTYTLTVRIGGHHKMVSCYAMCPERLIILMDRVEQLAQSEQWVQVPGRY